MKAHVNGIELSYHIYGRGEPLVLLHGNGQSHGAMKRQIDFFRKEYQVIAVDSRGHGKSELGFRPLDFQVMALDILCLLDFLKIDRYRVIGYSDGGIIALEMAMYQPKRQVQMVVIGTNYDTSQIKWWANIFTFVGYLFSILLTPFSFFFRRVKAQMGLMIFHPHIKERDLARISAPMLAVIGEYDVISKADTRNMVNLVQRGKMTVIHNGTHFLIRQKTRELHQVIVSFFDEDVT
ncbi:alpha/beta fold hydrolase [Listeria rustica]|uniref:Alpha/beta hydrolase n=1 Tax=Listeria rustica TaxID=2713503 RepID=A0A7W1T8H7_9LIST|nr:alpha/beta hydrolase [Listeria rustica]MBA3927383.1 alpha/beta hydrolase [Listeria rustica]